MPNKADLVEAISERAEISKKAASVALDTILDEIAKALKKGERVSFAGFGTFSVSIRSARQGRNPQTGAAIQIPASKVPRFKAGKSLREAVQ